MKKLAVDIDTAEKFIVKELGENLKMIEFRDFYKIFYKGIFRVALKDMLLNIENLCEGTNQEELPLFIKLAKYRRNMLLNGLDKNSKM